MPRKSATFISLVLVCHLVTPEVSAQEPAFGSCVEEVTAPAEVSNALDKVLMSLVHPEPERTAFGSASGAVLSVSAPGWRYVRSVGTKSAGGGTPVDCEMPYQIGSVTKMMTATLLLQLHEEGALSVDDPLSDHMPELAAQLPHGSAITLRQLADHRAGVFSYTDTAPDGALGLMEGGISDPAMLRARYSPSELIGFAIEHGQPSFAPGTDGAWAYSNTGYAVLGQLIERITAKPLEKVFEQRIFGPLGMRSSYLWSDRPRAHFGLPKAYLAAPFDVETAEWNMSQGWAAGAVISTVDEMTLFIEALLGGQLFETPETLQIMKQTVETGSPIMPAYGVGLGDKTAGFWGHAGQTLGFSSDTGHHPEHGLTIVVWTNSAFNPSQQGVLSVSKALRKLDVIPR